MRGADLSSPGPDESLTLWQTPSAHETAQNLPTGSSSTEVQARQNASERPQASWLLKEFEAATGHHEWAAFYTLGPAPGKDEFYAWDDEFRISLYELQQSYRRNHVD